MSYSKEELATYRLQRAQEALEEARVMTTIQHWNTAANRLYYACFYAASAYLISKELESSTHSGTKTAFNKELIGSGKINSTYGKIYNDLFALRQDADYRDFRDVTEAKINALIPEVELLIEIIKTLIII